MVYAYNGILFSLKKEWNNDIFYNKNEPWRHYVKWNKPDTKEQILIPGEGQVPVSGRGGNWFHVRFQVQSPFTSSFSDWGLLWLPSNAQAPRHRNYLSFSSVALLLEVWSCSPCIHSLIMVALPQSPELKISEPQSAFSNPMPLPVLGTAQRRPGYPQVVRRPPHVLSISWPTPEHVCR